MEAFANYFSGAPAAFVRRSDFGKDFIFGSATAAFQVEGRQHKGGRGDSIWDIFAKEHDLFHPYAEDAVNYNQKFVEDVKLMKEIGFDTYKFSISWSRILPTGKEPRNPEGIKYYKELINKLKQHGIEPFVTLFHWDVPQKLQQDYHGFLDRQIVDDFGNYAKVCFDEFGKDVNYWITMNEPFTFAYWAHVTNVHAPGLGTVHEHLFGTGIRDDHSGSMGDKNIPRKKIVVSKPSGDSRVCENEELDEFAYPYVVTHNLLLAHGRAVEIFRDKYKGCDEKKIGISLVSMWFEPRNPDSIKDQVAARRALDFFLGWFMDPLVRGDYPKSMRECVKKEHLPVMSDEDRKLIQGSYDFIGLNYCTARFVAHQEPKKEHTKNGRNYITDQHLMYYETGKFEDGKHMVPIGTDKGASAWLISYPQGIKDLLLHIKKNYNDPVIYITGNGIDDHDDECLRDWSSILDHKRVTHLHHHLKYISDAIREGVNVKGYFASSLVDSFEWNNGFETRFGLIYVDYKNGGNRHPKFSAAWLKHFLNGGKETSPSPSPHIDLGLINEHIQAIESKLLNQECKIKNLNDQIQALTAKPSCPPVDLEAIKKHIGSVESKLVSQERQIKNQNEQIQALTAKTSCTCPPVDLGTIKKQIETIESKLVNQERQIQALTTKPASPPVDLGPIKRQMETVESKLANQERQIQALNAKPSSPPVDLGPIRRQIETVESKLSNQERQIQNLNARPSSTAGMDRVSFGKNLVSSCRVPVVQEAIGKGLLRWASAEGSGLWRLAHWESLLDSAKHNAYGGGINLEAAIIKHPTGHGVNITIPSWVDDGEFSKIRNSQSNNNVTMG